MTRSRFARKLAASAPGLLGVRKAPRATRVVEPDDFVEFKILTNICYTGGEVLETYTTVRIPRRFLHQTLET